VIDDDGRVGDYRALETQPLLGVTADLLRSFGSAFGGRHLAIVGGMVPTLLVEAPPHGLEAHAGTGDLDLHVSLQLLDGETAEYYDSIVEGLAGLQLKPTVHDGRTRLWQWVGRVRGVRLQVDFLCPSRPGGRLNQSPAAGTNAELNLGSSDKIAALAMRFGHLVPFDTIEIERRVETAGGWLTYPFPVSDVTSWFCLKADAIVLRDKAKDAYDVVWVMAALGPEVVARRIADSRLLAGEHREDVLSQLRRLTDDLFLDVTSVGAVEYVKFLETPEDQVGLRYAVETVAVFKRALAATRRDG
jgi:hypothetical protein